MSTDAAALRTHIDRALSEGKPADALCYLAELVANHPDDRNARTALAIALGDAGHPAGALKVLHTLADRLAHQGLLLAAMVVVRHGLAHAPGDPGLVSTLKRLHVRGVLAKTRADAPPALKVQHPKDENARAEVLLTLSGQARLDRVTQIGCDFPPAGEAAIPLPMPLFSELEEEAFIEVVHNLRYTRVARGARILTEGQPGETLLVIATGHVDITKGSQQLAKLGPGTVLGEMALMTGAPRSASATAHEDVELFELSRADVEMLAKAKPQIAEELIAYCRKRLIGNLVQTSPLFRHFDESSRYGLLERFKRVGFTAGQTLIESGQKSEGLYVIVAGEVQLADKTNGTVLANLGPGDVVGEQSLLKDEPNTATVTAADRVGALFLPKSDFQSILLKNPQAREYLEGVGTDRQHASAGEAQEIPDDELIVL